MIRDQETKNEELRNWEEIKFFLTRTFDTYLQNVAIIIFPNFVTLFTTKDL